MDGLAKASAERAEEEIDADIIRLRIQRKIVEVFELWSSSCHDMIVLMILEYAKELASPLGNIDKITVFDTCGDEC